LRATACEIAYGFWSGAVDVLQALQDCMVAVKMPLQETPAVSLGPEAAMAR
jgi:hypothetical protein